jgi:hypothetical protein
MAAALATSAGSARVDAQQPPARDTIVAYPGFDTSAYPGDSVMRAWTYPASPFRWVGYYLAAPCHRDSTWAGRRASLGSMGWGLAAIYVGQQDWSRMEIGRVTPHARSDSANAPTTCSTTLLTTDRARIDAADAVARLRAEGFAEGSTVFLNVETVSDVTPTLMAYVRTWLSGVLEDGHYVPGIYAAKINAPPLRSTAVAAYRAARRKDKSPFWISSGAGFSLRRRPSDSGVSYASVWQGMFTVPQTFNGVKLIVDVDLASALSPSAPR